MKLNLAWRDAMLFAGREFSYAEQRAGWPPALRPMQLAALQRPYGGDFDEAGLPLNQAMLAAIKDACRAGSIEHTKHAHESHEERGFPRRKGGPIAFNTFARALQNELTDTIRITPQAFLPWLAEQGEQPSEHIVAWAKANGVSVPDAPKAALTQGAAAAQGEAVTAAPAAGAALVPLAAVPARFVKRAVLLKELQDEWGTIESDLKQASNNGLTAAAYNGHAWDIDKARKWAAERGKLGAPIKQATPVDWLANAWTGPVKKHKCA